MTLFSEIEKKLPDARGKEVTEVTTVTSGTYGVTEKKQMGDGNVTASPSPIYQAAEIIQEAHDDVLYEFQQIPDDPRDMGSKWKRKAVKQFIAGREIAAVQDAVAEQFQGLCRLCGGGRCGVVGAGGKAGGAGNGGAGNDDGAASTQLSMAGAGQVEVYLERVREGMEYWKHLILAKIKGGR